MSTMQHPLNVFILTKSKNIARLAHEASRGLDVNLSSDAYQTSLSRESCNGSLIYTDLFASNRQKAMETIDTVEHLGAQVFYILSKRPGRGFDELHREIYDWNNFGFGRILDLTRKSTSSTSLTKPAPTYLDLQAAIRYGILVKAVSELPAEKQDLAGRVKRIMRIPSKGDDGTLVNLMHRIEEYPLDIVFSDPARQPWNHDAMEVCVLNGFAEATYHTEGDTYKIVIGASKESVVRDIAAHHKEFYNETLLWMKDTLKEYRR